MSRDGWVSRNSTVGGSDLIVLVYIYGIVIFPLPSKGHFTGTCSHAVAQGSRDVTKNSLISVIVLSCPMARRTNSMPMKEQ
jgi:hypothetical protein